jgi:hypothetical protein
MAAENFVEAVHGSLLHSVQAVDILAGEVEADEGSATGS